MAASVPDPGVFNSGRDFAAWLGLTPRQISSGGRPTLGAITKAGNRYIRKLLVLGATSLLKVVEKRRGGLRDWIVGLLAKKPARLVTVAPANKLARITWAMMKTGECFRTEMFAKPRTECRTAARVAPKGRKRQASWIISRRPRALPGVQGPSLVSLPLSPGVEGRSA
ncbi:transposase [Bradyrhizobium sp. 45]|uniref:transposase n=1 Tax=Bradyrhizobium sp. 45 TaxID=1043587 RepID=UPI001FF8AE43